MASRLMSGGLRGARIFARRPVLVQARRRVGQQAAGSTSDTSTWLSVAAVGVCGVAAYVLYAGNRQPRPLVEQKKEEYKKSGSTHPEAVAEEQLTPQPSPLPSSSSPPADEPITTPTSPSLPNKVPYVLVGGGTASFAAAQEIRKRDSSAKIIIVTDEQFPPYSRPPLSKHLWMSADHEAAKQLRFAAPWAGGKIVDVFYSMEFCEPHELMDREEGGLSVLKGSKVVGLDARNKTVTLESGHVISYDKCLLATGGQPRTLPVFDAAPKKHVSVYRKIPDYQSLDSLLEHQSSVLVVGGGFLGTELAVGMATRYKEKGLKVIQLFPESGNLGLVLPPALTAWTTGKVKKEGVEVFPGTTVTKVEEGEAKEGGVKLTTSSGDELSVDHVVVAVGLEPNTQLAKSGRLETDPEMGGYRVNSELQACTDVWVAGDVCSFFDPHLGRRRVEHHDHAQVSGRLAGANMAGDHQQFDHQSMFWSDVGPDVGFEATGLIDAALPTLGIYPRKEGEDAGLPVDDHSRGVVFYLTREERRIVGVLTWNMFGKMDLARKIITEGRTEKDIGGLASEFDLRTQQE